MKKKKKGFLLAFPAISGFLFFYLIPFLIVLWYSVSFGIGKREFVGLDNYKELLKNKILISLVKNGYIKENYEKNLSYFKSGDLTQEDYSFLIMVDTNEKTQFDYKVKNIGKIVEIIQVKDFKQESVLNHYVCDYLTTHLYYPNLIFLP